jgi:hypothetical protein
VFFLFISTICWNCSNRVVFFVYFYHMFELFLQCGSLCLFLSYVGTVPTVWYFMFISIICWNCYNSVVFYVYFYHMLELLQQCGILCLFLSYVGTVTTMWYFLFSFHQYVVIKL